MARKRKQHEINNSKHDGNHSTTSNLSSSNENSTSSTSRGQPKSKKLRETTVSEKRESPLANNVNKSTTNITIQPDHIKKEQPDKQEKIDSHPLDLSKPKKSSKSSKKPPPLSADQKQKIKQIIKKEFDREIQTKLKELQETEKMMERTLFSIDTLKTICLASRYDFDLDAYPVKQALEYRKDVYGNFGYKDLVGHEDDSGMEFSGEKFEVFDNYADTSRGNQAQNDIKEEPKKFSNLQPTSSSTPETGSKPLQFKRQPNFPSNPSPIIFTSNGPIRSEASGVTLPSNNMGRVLLNNKGMTFSRAPNLPSSSTQVVTNNNNVPNTAFQTNQTKNPSQNAMETRIILERKKIRFQAGSQSKNLPGKNELFIFFSTGKNCRTKAQEIVKKLRFELEMEDGNFCSPYEVCPPKDFTMTSCLKITEKMVQTNTFPKAPLACRLTAFYNYEEYNKIGVFRIPLSIDYQAPMGQEIKGKVVFIEQQLVVSKKIVRVMAGESVTTTITNNNNSSKPPLLPNLSLPNLNVPGNTTIKNLTPSPNFLNGKIVGSRPGSGDALMQQMRPASVGNISDSGHSLDPRFGGF